jgi:hypothetical protein
MSQPVPAPPAASANTGPKPHSDGLGPMPLRIEDVYRLVGALYLEVDLLRRHVQMLQAALNAQVPTESVSSR